MNKGDSVATPGGIGRLYAIEGDTAIVEMDYTYLVEYPLSEVKPYEVPVQEEAQIVPAEGLTKGSPAWFYGYLVRPRAW